MNFWTGVHFFSFLVYTFAIFYVIVKNPFAVTNWVLAMLFFYFALWSGCSTILDNNSVDIVTAAAVMKIQCVGWTSFIAYYFLFILFLTNNKKLLSNPLIYLGIVALPAIFIYHNFNGEVLVCCKKMDYGIGGTWSSSIWAYSYFAYYIVVFVWATYLLFKHRNSTRIESERRVSGIMLISACTVFTIGTITNVVMNNLGIYVPADVNVIFLIFVFGFIYSAEKYETFTLSSTRNAERIMEMISEGIILIGSDGAMTTANRAALEIFGFPGGVITKDAFGFIETQIKSAGITAQEGEITNFELAFKDAHGISKSALISSRILARGGDNSGRVCSIRDITGKKKAEVDLVAKVNELRRSNEELENFAYVASHDLKEPLRMVTSYVQLIRKKFRDKLGSDGNDYIDFASDGAIRMSDLIEGLLEYSRVRKSQKDFSEVDTNEVLEKVLNIMRLKIQDKKALITVRGKLPIIKAERMQMEQLFQNLISNALKFTTAEPPVITLSAEKSGEIYEFLFRDNGIGIEKEYREKIFQIFQRLHARNEYEGTGIGLAICRKIVDSHGGKIWVESEGAGKGCDFKFTIPA